MNAAARLASLWFASRGPLAQIFIAAIGFGFGAVMGYGALGLMLLLVFGHFEHVLAAG